MSRYDIVCFHTIVGYAPAHAAHFSVARDGTIYQSRDTAYQSGANLDGNHRVISIETADMPPTWNTADGHAVPDFTPQQIESTAQICAWAHQVHGIPLIACPDSKPTSRGIGYHRQGIDGAFLANGYAYPGRVSGGELWTTSPGKVCPGDPKIARRPQIITRAIAITQGDDDMTYGDADRAVAADTQNKANMAQVYARQTLDELRAMALKVAMLADDEAKILAAIAAIPTVDPQALADALAPLLPPGVALTPDDVAAIAAAAAVTVNDELASRTSPSA